MEVMTAMEASQARWNDDRLDEFARSVDRRFDEVDKRFDKVDERFDRLEGRMESGFARVDDRFERLEGRFDDLMKVLMLAFVSMIGVLVAAILSFVATQL
jgi:predicted nuclease with TOPRIM domain